MFLAELRINSSGALPVLAITGFRFCCKTNGKPYNVTSLIVPEHGPIYKKVYNIYVKSMVLFEMLVFL